jgi:hypothetical protein
MRYKKTRLLKIEYQRVLGKSIDVCTWNRIKSQLNISDDSDLSHAPIVRAAAILRRKSPKKRITRLDCEQYVWLSENMPKLYCSGRQLWEALQRLKPHPPSRVCVFKWGREIKSPFYLNAWYTPEDLEKWLEKVLRSRFYYELTED